LNKPQKPVKTTPARREPSNQHTSTMEEIRNLTEEQAKLLLQYAMSDLHNAIYNPAPINDMTHLGWLTQKIETLSKENTK